MAMAMQSVILAAQTTISREGVKLLIDSMEEFGLVAVTSSIEDTLSACQANSRAILVLGNCRSHVGALEILLELKRKKLTNKAVVLSGEPCPQLERKIATLPVCACVQLADPPERLVEALRAARDGRKFELSPQIESTNGIADLVVESELEDPLEPLSNREREIFRLLADGLQNAAIARKLFISPRTVETHRARIVRKLNLQSNADLIRYAIRNGISAV